MRITEKERLAKKEKDIESQAFTCWIREFRTLRLKWCKAERVRLRVAGKTRPQIAEIVNP